MEELQIPLTVETLSAMTPIVNGCDIIRLAARHLLLSHVKSQQCVRATFFSSHTPVEAEAHIDPDWFDFDTFGCLVMCQALAAAEDPFGISRMLHREKIDAKLEDIYASPQWRRMGFALYSILFQDMVKDDKRHISFRRYMDNDRCHWAAALSAHVRSSKWLYSVIRPIIKGEYSDCDYRRDLNILFIKLHLLDPSTVMPTYEHLNKAFPDLHLELATTNYLGEPLPSTLLQPAVDAAIDKATYPCESPRFTADTLHVFYGVGVLEFIYSHARRLELCTGSDADNMRVSHFWDRNPRLIVYTRSSFVKIPSTVLIYTITEPVVGQKTIHFCLLNHRATMLHYYTACLRVPCNKQSTIASQHRVIIIMKYCLTLLTLALGARPTAIDRRPSVACVIPRRLLGKDRVEATTTTPFCSPRRRRSLDFLPSTSDR
ncbi:hypothetical protein LSAT2_000337 [Lamellibrachia satsuma]|nr:hypothetical protein LSAT2_000337 [Lamellibrachia satsuma]